MLNHCLQQVRLEGDREGPFGMIKKNKAQADMGELLCVLPRRQLAAALASFWKSGPLFGPVSSDGCLWMLPGAAWSLCHPLCAKQMVPKLGLKHLQGVSWG